MRLILRLAATSSMAAIVSLAVPHMAGAQATCAPAGRASASVVSNTLTTSATISLHGRDVSLRDALDRLAAAARIRISYSAELLDLSRAVCLEYESAPVSAVLADLIARALVRPVRLGTDQIVLTLLQRKLSRRSRCRFLNQLDSLTALS